MYAQIMVTLDQSQTDEAIIEHISELAKVHHSHVILLRVTHSHTRDQLAYSTEEAEEYTQGIAEHLVAKGIDVEVVITPGEPAEEIVRQAEERKVDLIAMATHGHKGVYDLMLGSVAEKVRHETSIPVLMVRGSLTA